MSADNCHNIGDAVPVGGQSISFLALAVSNLVLGAYNANIVDGNVPLCPKQINATMQPQHASGDVADC